jgi:DNA-binding transcriptional MerR regulator
MDDLKLIDTKALARLLDVSTRTVLRWTKLQKLPKPTMDDGRKYWTMRQIEDWQERKREC